MKADVDILNSRIKQLEAENKRLRDALEKILEVRGHAGDDWDIKTIAELALEQSDD